jgi:hypothetical protein
MSQIGVNAVGCRRQACRKGYSLVKLWLCYVKA